MHMSKMHCGFFRHGAVVGLARNVVSQRCNDDNQSSECVFVISQNDNFPSLCGLIRICRKFRCTRNYIHVNLFSSFVLRASAVFIKDTVLFADESLDHCSMSTVSTPVDQWCCRHAASAWVSKGQRQTGGTRRWRQMVKPFCHSKVDSFEWSSWVLLEKWAMKGEILMKY